MTAIIFIDGAAASATHIAIVDSTPTNDDEHSLNIAIGDEPGVGEENRLVAIAVHTTHTNSSFALLSATIGGIAAHLGGIAVGYNGAVNAGTATVWIWAYVPTGTSATVALTFNSACICQLASFRVVNIQSDTPVDSAENVDDTGSPTTVTAQVDVRAHGVALGAGTGVGIEDTTWAISGVGQDYSSDTSGNRVNWTGGHLDVTADETDRSITITKNKPGEISTEMMTVAAISFR